MVLSQRETGFSAAGHLTSQLNGVDRTPEAGGRSGR